MKKISRRARSLGGPARAGVLAALLALLAATPGSGYTLIRTTGFTQPGAHWPVSALPLATLISSAGSDDVPDSSDTSAIIAAETTWNQINTDYFAFAVPSVGTGTSLNLNDGINSIFFDEAGTNFPAGTTAIAFTALNIDGTTGEISDGDLVFNGRDMTFSTATPTPSTAFDIQSIATHELGHMTGLDHASIISAVMFPVGAKGAQFMRNLGSDDRLGDAFLYPESVAGTGIAGLQAGDGDLALITGTISGSVQTSGGVAVPGAAVVALDPNGAAVVSDVSGTDGSYQLTGLAPGGYQVYAEPLDGVTVEQDLSQGDFMNAFAPFTTTFLGGNTTPATVTVTAGADSPGNVVNLGAIYGVETEANNTFSAANPVALEALTSGISNPAGDVDYFGFAGTLGDIVNIDVDASGDGRPFDPYVTLFSTNGTTALSVNDDFKGKGNDSRIVQPLPATGNFYVRVEDFSNVPPSTTPVGGPGFFYTIHVNKAIAETENNNTPGAANAAAFGQYRGGIISATSDVDYYKITLTFGKHLLAEVSANRAGSPLDPALTLFAADGTTVLMQNDDIDLAGGNKDALIDYTCISLCNPNPMTAFLKVSAQSGAGSNAFYVLHLGTDFLTTFYSGTNTFGQGINGGPTLDIFPKFPVQGSAFDLIVGGPGIPIPPGPSLSVSGPGVTLTSTSPSSSYAANSQGIDFFAMSATVSGSAPPGPRTVFTQFTGQKAALSGAFVITPSGVPPEEGAPAAPLIWSGGQMSWGADPSASFYNVYRGSFPFADLDANGVADSYGSPFACGLTSPLAADPNVPGPGGGFFYLVTGRNANGEGTLGFTRNNAGTGPERPKSALTATCP